MTGNNTKPMYFGNFLIMFWKYCQWSKKLVTYKTCRCFDILTHSVFTFNCIQRQPGYQYLREFMLRKQYSIQTTLYTIFPFSYEYVVTYFLACYFLKLMLHVLLFLTILDNETFTMSMLYYVFIINNERIQKSVFKGVCFYYPIFFFEGYESSCIS